HGPRPGRRRLRSGHQARRSRRDPGEGGRRGRCRSGCRRRCAGGARLHRDTDGRDDPRRRLTPSLLMAVLSTVNRASPAVETPAGQAAPAILSVEHIAMHFVTGEDSVAALDDISFEVAPGEFLAVIGPSGCGKSTLFNIIGGLLGGYDGRVTVDGEKVAGPHP